MEALFQQNFQFLVADLSIYFRIIRLKDFADFPVLFSIDDDLMYLDR